MPWPRLDMVGRPPFVGFLLASLLGAAACSTFGADSSQVPTPPDDASAPDATLTDDGGVTDGAAADAGDASRDAARPCDQPHWLCDDFDTDASPPWTPYVTGPGATLLDQQDPSAPSPPRILRATAPPASVASLVRSDGANVPTLHCSFAMRVAQRDVLEGYVLDLQLPAGNLDYRIGLSLPPGSGLKVQAVVTADGGTIGNATASATVADGAWVRVGLDVVPTMGKVRASLNGVSFLDVGTLPATGVPVGAYLKIGPASYSLADSGAPAWIVDFDDLVCDDPQP
jgi:hypothetical protein